MKQQTLCSYNDPQRTSPVRQNSHSNVSFNKQNYNILFFPGKGKGRVVRGREDQRKMTHLYSFKFFHVLDQHQLAFRVRAEAVWLVGLLCAVERIDRSQRWNSFKNTRRDTTIHTEQRWRCKQSHSLRVCTNDAVASSHSTPPPAAPALLTLFHNLPHYPTVGWVNHMMLLEPTASRCRCQRCKINAYIACYSSDPPQRIHRDHPWMSRCRRRIKCQISRRRGSHDQCLGELESLGIGESNYPRIIQRVSVPNEVLPKYKSLHNYVISDIIKFPS